MKFKRFLKLSSILLFLILVLKYFETNLKDPTDTIRRDNIEQTTKAATSVFDTKLRSERIKSSLKVSLLDNEQYGKLITLFVTFVDISGENLNEAQSYRRLAQMNFLQTSQFPNLKAKIFFVIYTNCSYWLEVIGAKYPHVHTLPLRLRAPFKVPLFKDLVMQIMEKFNTPFYMYANADNIYDSSLIRTVNAILNALQFGLLRSKLLVIGHRFNVVPKRIIQDENEVEELRKIAQPNKPFAKDYTIFTRDSFDWISFPDLLVARQFLDSYIVDYAFHNEIQVIDATATISLVHQAFQLGYSTGMNADPEETSWNNKIYGVKTSHSSILCSTYRTNYSSNSKDEILIYNKIEETFLSAKKVDTFSNDYYMTLNDFQSYEEIEPFRESPTLTLIINTENKPESLARLLNALHIIPYNNVVDLIININKCHSGLYDLETLKVALEFHWKYGHKTISLKDQHLSQINIWLEVDKLMKGYSPFLLLQDDVMVSEHFYTALNDALLECKHTAEWVEGRIGGISLEPPLTFPADIVVYLKLTKEYRENLLLAQPMRSRALYPNPFAWEFFTEWVRRSLSDTSKFNTKELSNTFAAQSINYGDKTEWYKEMADVWYSYYLEQIRGSLGYLVHSKGVLATWAYRGLEGTYQFLGFNCSLSSIRVKTHIPILWYKNPQFYFSKSPHSISIKQIEKLY